jgi:hypothetical protein
VRHWRLHALVGARGAWLRAGRERSGRRARAACTGSVRSASCSGRPLCLCVERQRRMIEIRIRVILCQREDLFRGRIDSSQRENYFEGGLIPGSHFDCYDLVGDLITGYAPHNLDY